MSSSSLNVPSDGEGSSEQPIATEQHAILILPEVDLMLKAVFDDVERARERVLIECYIYMDDTLGRAFGEALARAAARGVLTRMIFDPLGSHKADGDFFDDLRRRGVDVRAYRPSGVALAGGGFGPRDHSRIIVADHAAYTGGAAWADQWLPEKHGGEGWHDVCVRVEGPVVEDFARVFDRRWSEANGEADRPKDIDTEGAYPDVRLVADTPKRQSLVYLRHREAIRNARRRVWMENAYFFPSVPLLQDLYDAAARGVDVQIMLPGETDLPVMKRAALAEYEAWLDHGLTLWEYQPRVLHSKFAVIDDHWCTIGTFNANPTSLGLANEVNLFVFNPAFVGRVARQFEMDRAKCERVTRESIRSRSVLNQAVDALANNAMVLVDVIMGPASDSGRLSGEGEPQ